MPDISAVAQINEMLDNDNDSFDELISCMKDLNIENIDDHNKVNYLEHLYSEHEKSIDEDSVSHKYINRDRIQVLNLCTEVRPVGQFCSKTNRYDKFFLGSLSCTYNLKFSAEVSLIL